MHSKISWLVIVAISTNSEVDAYDDDFLNIRYDLLIIVYLLIALQ